MQGNGVVPQLVIFDFNGTLQDDAALYYEYSVRRMFERFGLPPPTREEFSTAVAATDYIGFFHARGIPRWLDDRAFYAWVYEEMVRDGAAAPLFSDALQVLDALRDSGRKLAIVSGMNADALNVALVRHGIADRFTAIRYGMGDKRAALLEVCARLEIAPDHAWVVEDMAEGLHAARAAGMRAFGCPRGHHARTRLEAVRAEHPEVTIIETLTALLAFLPTDDQAGA